MRSWILGSLLVVAAAVAVAGDDLPLATTCNQEACVAPDCRCSSVEVPGGLQAKDIPQFVMVTFDDAINILNIETYRDVLYNRRNFNGCRAGATFYMSHEYTNYQLVNELYNNGFEIALHSISHQTPQTYWAQAEVETMRQEFADQRILTSHFASIPINSLQGIRMPFLQLAGNSSFVVMKEQGMTYDCSWPTIGFVNPGLWPYTLDYSSNQDCPVPPCPTASIPGQWVVPMISWRDLNGVPCSMADACFSPPPLTDEDAWLTFITENFERHYLNNRAPFGIFFHEWYLRAYPAVARALSRFLDMINSINDVFMVNTNEVVDWIKNPVSVDEYRSRGCPFHQPTGCVATSCGPLSAPHKEELYWMAICGTCPRVYPWLGNPLGVET